MRITLLPLYFSMVLTAFACLTGCASQGTSSSASNTLRLHLRSRQHNGAGATEAREHIVQWDPKRTAIIVCDMWDDHWCKSAASRVGELLDPMNRTLDAARAKGVFVIHAPSSVTGFYEGTRARKLAQKAPHAPTPFPLAQTERWGTRWYWSDGSREGVLPIDDTDMGCSCKDAKCAIR